MWEDTLPADDGPAASPDVTLTRGVELGQFIVLGELGRGGMGVIHAAYDPELDRKVALKLMRDERESGSRGMTRLQREARALARLSHPNTVAIYDVGTFGDRTWVAMELVSGQTLAAWLAESPRTWSQVLEIVRAAGEGVAAAHAAGLVHRDIKPDNVMLGTDGRVRVVDFGLARASGDTPTKEDASQQAALEPEDSMIEPRHVSLSHPLTQAGARPGTPAYMAPEQIAANRRLTARASSYIYDERRPPPIERQP
jgi:eukaryotic-like serine/threonine-protein kinase